MIGLLLCNALALAYGAAYCVHSIRKKRAAAIVTVIMLSLLLAGASAWLVLLGA